MARNMIGESVWFEQPRVEAAENVYQEAIAQCHSGLEVVGRKIAAPAMSGGALSSIEQARGLIGQALNQPPVVSRSNEDFERRLGVLEEENKTLRTCVAKLEGRMTALEGGGSVTKATAPAKDNDDDFDLFGSDEDEPLPVATPPVVTPPAKKPKKVVVAKSSLVLDVKPWDDETDMAAMETNVRSVTSDGLLWGASKILPVAYGIMKLQISCVIEDDKIGTDFLEESITAFDDIVQSVDVVAFNKI